MDTASNYQKKTEVWIKSGEKTICLNPPLSGRIGFLQIYRNEETERMIEPDSISLSGIEGELLCDLGIEEHVLCVSSTSISNRQSDNPVLFSSL